MHTSSNPTAIDRSRLKRAVQKAKITAAVKRLQLPEASASRASSQQDTAYRALLSLFEEKAGSRQGGAR